MRSTLPSSPVPALTLTTRPELAARSSVPAGSHSREPKGTESKTDLVPSARTAELERELSVTDRVDGFAALGLVLYLDGAGLLRAHGPPRLIEAARPAIAQHRAAIVAQLRSVPKRTGAADHESVARAQPIAATSVSGGVCPNCARQ